MPNWWECVPETKEKRIKCQLKSSKIPPTNYAEKERVKEYGENDLIYHGYWPH